ncbi:MAG: phosphohydrolase [Magnetococcus sp. YQC-5]
MAKQRHGAWIQTFTGIQFWPMDARPEEVEILDIAHSLSLLCRFNGHCRRFYSVAEHSVHVSDSVAPEHALWGLLHDGAEAYIADLPQPIKRHMLEFQAIEEHLLRVIGQRFGLPLSMPAEVKYADKVLLSTEKSVLMGPEPAPWMTLPPPLDPVRIQGWEPTEAKQRFLHRFKELVGGDGPEGHHQAVRLRS